ncbi:MAG: hypothetical protein KGJ89_00280 [Patescibacteria group bacterium]|nr:hypothetical protein [Patescibacteria group bacterium]MDE2014957.1 hypothetical protein [Patescibacteria group bacterium]MDE2226386.1 hypothetical protein [Patescibacteria group bacterium]
MWNFRNLELDHEGKIRSTPLSDLQQRKVYSYGKALEVAHDSSVSMPIFSNYFVRGSIGIWSGEFLPVGNIEYGVMQALHCEECAVAAFRSRYGWSEQGDIIFGFTSVRKEFNSPPTCCGNCRDVILGGLGTDFEFVCGNRETHEAAVSSMRLLLFDVKKKAVDLCGETLEYFQGLAEELLREEKKLTNDAYSPRSVFPDRRYSALIMGKDHYIGAIDGMCEYHPIYPLRDAVRQMRRANSSILRYVFILHDEELSPGPPHVMYKDRQHLLELNLQCELLWGEERDIPVFLVNHRKGIITEVWQTTSKEWLPFPFTPKNFGGKFLEDLKTYYLSIPK